WLSAECRDGGRVRQLAGALENSDSGLDEWKAVASHRTPCAGAPNSATVAKSNSGQPEAPFPSDECAQHHCDNTRTVTYTRRRDLSGTVDGAGGIGGLLARSHGYSSGSWAYHNFYHADGNGNVTALVNNGSTLQASYIYDPYGRYFTGAGTLLTSNAMRFSSKPWVSFLSSSASTGLYYYGYRFYDPYLQRWLNRDRIDESTPVNIYFFVANDPVQAFDPWGLYEERQNRRGSTDIIVENCEIVILYGHGSLQNPHRFVFNGPFSFGHFVGCGDEATNERIRRKGRDIPGAPSTTEDLHSGPSARWHPDLMFDKHLDETIAAARKLAKDLCDSGKCKRVTIYTVAAGPDSPMNPVASNRNLRTETKEVVECCSGK
ncbi:MAG: RHS repeat-associated core domain-containing protein, partial [Verrucomicrobia bacterium]|nr:RHS repeat-associated core domain-containing protein [Verrucomicrobiota bacterium]